MSKQKVTQWMLLGGLGAAAAIYFGDPRRGAQRRARVARVASDLYEKTREETEKSLRDLQNQLAGFSARLRARAGHATAGDRVIEERVRSRIGRAVSHARKVRVVSDNGVVTLWGPVLDHEAPGLLHVVSSTPGVAEVRDHLEMYAPDDPASPLARLPSRHEDPLRHARKETRLNWRPAQRMAIGVTGAALAVWGLTRKDRGAAENLLALAGAGMLAGSTMRNRLSATLAIGEDSPGFEIERTIKINAPISDLYDFWANPENYPRAFSHVARIERLGENLYRWTLNGPAGIPIGWEGSITRAIPNTLVEFKSLRGASIGNFGIVRFHPDYDASTRVHIRMFYRPPAGILGRILAELLGADAGDILDQDLQNLKEFFEGGRYLTEERKKKREEAELLRTATT